MTEFKAHEIAAFVKTLSDTMVKAIASAVKGSDGTRTPNANARTMDALIRRGVANDRWELTPFGYTVRAWIVGDDEAIAEKQQHNDNTCKAENPEPSPAGRSLPCVRRDEHVTHQDSMGRVWSDKEVTYGRVGTQYTAHIRWGSTARCSQALFLGDQVFTKAQVQESPYLALCERCRIKAQSIPVLMSAHSFGTENAPATEHATTPPVRLTPSQQHGLRQLIKAEQEGRSVNDAALNLHGRVRHGLRDKGVLDFVDTPTTVGDVEITLGRYVLTTAGRALGYTLPGVEPLTATDVAVNALVTGNPVAEADAAALANVIKEATAPTPVHFQTSPTTIKCGASMFDNIHNVTVRADRVTCPDCKTICKTCRQPIIRSVGGQFPDYVHVKVGWQGHTATPADADDQDNTDATTAPARTRTMANYTCGGVTGHSQACDRATCVRLPDLQAGTFVEAVPAGTQADGSPITRAIRVEIDRQPWMHPNGNVILSDGQGVTAVRADSLRVDVAAGIDALMALVPAELVLNPNSHMSKDVPPTCHVCELPDVPMDGDRFQAHSTPLGHECVAGGLTLVELTDADNAPAPNQPTTDDGTPRTFAEAASMAQSGQRGRVRNRDPRTMAYPKLVAGTPEPAFPEHDARRFVTNSLDGLADDLRGQLNLQAGLAHALGYAPTYAESLPDECRCKYVNKSDNSGWELVNRNRNCPVHGDQTGSRSDREAFLRELGDMLNVNNYAGVIDAVKARGYSLGSTDRWRKACDFFRNLNGEYTDPAALALQGVTNLNYAKD